MRRAARHGVSGHSVVSWVHRKTGGRIVVARFTADGRAACSRPCAFCSKALALFGMTPTYFDELGEARVGIPESPKLTSGQRRRFGRGGRDLLPDA